MPTQGSFNLPDQKFKSTDGARSAFHDYWGRPFYGDDEDIRLWSKEVPSSNLLQVKPIFGTTSRCQTLLWIMMERGPAQPALH